MAERAAQESAKAEDRSGLPHARRHTRLAAKGLVHWTHGRVEITLEGIREASQQPHDASGRTENADGR